MGNEWEMGNAIYIFIGMICGYFLFFKGVKWEMCWNRLFPITVVIMCINCFVHEFAVLMAFGSVFLRVRFIQST